MNPTFKETLHVSWAIYWKYALLCLPTALLPAVIFGFIFGIVAYAIGFNSTELGMVPQILGGLVGLVMNFLLLTFLLRRTLGKPKGGWVLSLSRAESVN
nr:hypothetical protein [uncultured Cohaesibacter sp.]